MKMSVIAAKDMITAATNPPTTDEDITAVGSGVLVFDGLGLVASEVEPLKCMCRDDQQLHTSGDIEVPCWLMLRINGINL